MKDHPKKTGEVKIHSQEILSLLDILQPFFIDDESEQQLFSQIKQLLTDLDFDHFHTERAYLGFLNLLFQAVMSQIPPDSKLHAQLQSIKQQLEPPIDLQSVDVLYQTVHSVAKKLQDMRVFSVEQASLIVNPIIMEYAIARKQAQVRKAKLMAQYDPNLMVGNEKPEIVNPSNGNQSQAGSASHRYTAEIRPKPSFHFGSRSSGESEESLPRREQRRILGADRRSKTSTIDTLINGEEQNNYHKLIQGLQKDFIRQTRTAVTQIAGFSEQIEQEIASLRIIDGVEDIQKYRDTVVASLEKLQDRHNKLASNFETARTYLSVIESGSQQLMDELDRVRLLSLTDELTGLPNRRAFLRRLQYEVSRVKRYQHPITLVIVDLDHFKTINDQYGHEGGDEVLKLYANKLFSLFRHHDSVARYGGEEFVMLFPDTGLSGVLKALEKIQEKCKAMTVTISGVAFPLPSFSAGVVEYQRGESSEHFIARADKELYRAKRGGRSRVAYDRSGAAPLQPPIDRDEDNSLDAKSRIVENLVNDELVGDSKFDSDTEADIEVKPEAEENGGVETTDQTEPDIGPAIVTEKDTHPEQETNIDFESERVSVRGFEENSKANAAVERVTDFDKTIESEPEEKVETESDVVYEYPDEIEVIPDLGPDSAQEQKIESVIEATENIDPETDASREIDNRLDEELESDAKKAEIARFDPNLF